MALHPPSIPPSIPPSPPSLLQGLALDLGRQLLYVADTLNDRVRMVDLKARDAVSTLRPSNAPVAKYS
ncbi:hypothetical protein Naga_102775g1 [Nannochloropsis gaditana]|uniref:Uncharacterized protein n=1 Tax=Nannochloropsis gaditana TaxID=72520 RepID=W7SZQ5_9STRA|nr:hypothetical protein Naga_102775g1 [Nannochloropsis gaditana]